VTVPAVIELLEGPRFCTLAPERSCERDDGPDLTVDEPPRGTCRSARRLLRGKFFMMRFVMRPPLNRGR
jgi:hypothetical protein